MSMMTHGAMLWGPALYNNGSIPLKRAAVRRELQHARRPAAAPDRPAAERVGDAGQGRRPVPRPAAPVRGEPAGQRPADLRARRPAPRRGRPARPARRSTAGPRARLSVRGLGTRNRTDPVFVSLTKTRLLDPTLNFLGTNDHPGDYRSSGCTACHVVYANDRSPVHSGPFADAGHLGPDAEPRPDDPQGRARATRSSTGSSRGIPTSQCIVCHVHPGTNVMNSYLGYTWWDEETDGELMYPREQKHPTAEEFTQAQMSNPDEAAARGLWSDPRFLERVADLNPQARHTQFADFHGHGWVFRAVFKKDRKGELLDTEGRGLGQTTDRAAHGRDRHAQRRPRAVPDRRDGAKPAPPPNRDGIPVHLMDIHMEKGMHCVDCHFVQDVHGNTRLQQEVRAAIEIQCIDCHGTADKHADPADLRPRLVHLGPEGPRTSRRCGPPRASAGSRSRTASSTRTRWSRRTSPGSSSRRPTRSTRRSEHYNEKSHLAKTVRFGADGRMDWGDLPGGGEDACAHADKNMSCIACHSSWNPSCFGCHLPQKANKKMPALHNEGDVSRNYVVVQLPDLARRRVHARPRRRRDGQPDRPGAVVVRDPRRLVQRQPRVDLRPAADDLGRGAQRDRLQLERPAHRPRRPDAASRAAPTRAAPSPPRRTCPAGTRPSNAPTATSRRPTTTTRSWPSS